MCNSQRAVTLWKLHPKPCSGHPVPVEGNPAHGRGLQRDVFGGLIQPKPFCDPTKPNMEARCSERTTHLQPRVTLVQC